MPRAKTPYQLCLALLRERGMLMASNGSHRSVTLVVRAALASGATWRDPTASRLVDVRRRLIAHDDILTLKLVGGRSTLVHRTRWPDLLAMAVSGAPWQVGWLPRREADLLELVEERGRVVVDAALADRLDTTLARFGRELERRILVLSDGGHAEPTGRVFTSWWTWADEQGVAPSHDEEAARLRLDAAARTLGVGAWLPWSSESERRRF